MGRVGERIERRPARSKVVAVPSGPSDWDGLLEISLLKYTYFTSAQPKTNTLFIALNQR